MNLAHAFFVVLGAIGLAGAFYCLIIATRWCWRVFTEPEVLPEPEADERVTLKQWRRIVDESES